MDTFDYVIMTVGGALIVVGLYLYVCGKQEGGTTNNLEGFGIKLNVSNPSILLIVVGVVLLLMPRFFPNSSLPIANAPLPNTVVPKASAPALKNSNETEDLAPPRAKTKNSAASEYSPKTKDPIKKAPSRGQQEPFLPLGVWRLSAYSENGIDLSENIKGTMTYTKVNANSVNWSSRFISTDIWGNTYNYHYRGVTSARGNTYQMQITASNDPNFVVLSPVQVEILLENGGTLHTRYYYQGKEILLHWQQ